MSDLQAGGLERPGSSFPESLLTADASELETYIAGLVHDAYQEGLMVAADGQTARMFSVREQEDEPVAEEAADQDSASEQLPDALSDEDLMARSFVVWSARAIERRQAARREIKRGAEIKLPHVERVAARTQAQEKSRPKADRYVPGKGRLLSRSVAIEQEISMMHEEVPASARRPLLTQRQSRTVHEAWDMHETAGRAIVEASMDIMFADAAETAETAAASPTGQLFWLDTAAVREYRASKDRRDRDLRNRRLLDGYDAEESVAEAA